MKKLIVEFIGTFFLVLVIGMVTSRSFPYEAVDALAPISIGALLMALVYMGGPVSGAHYNPAVTLGVMLRKKIQLNEALQYMAAQIAGALAAAAVFYLIFKVPLNPPAPALGFHSPMKPLLLEMLFTFVLVSVVLNVATTKKAAGNSYFGLAIGFTVAASAIAVGPFTGGAFNPAVALGPMFMDAILGGSSISNAWLYLVGQFAGAICASIVFRITNPDEMTA